MGERRASFLDGDAEPRLLTGWGRTAPTLARVSSPSGRAQVEKAVMAAGERGVLARGLGRSYGDAAQNAGGSVVSMTSLAGVREIDLDGDRITVGAGMSVEALGRMLVPMGRFLPVVPGTGLVTVGGAIASDIHGKNHHRDGAFGNHLIEFELLTPKGERLRINRRESPDTFDATVGGMGLTGVILEATLSLLRIQTSRMRVDTERARDLDDLMARMDAGDAGYRYSVAWIDCLARGSTLGRSVLLRGDHAELDDLSEDDRRLPLGLSVARRIPAPPWAPHGLLRPATMRAFNEVFFRRAPLEERGRLETLGEFFHPLDSVGDWNRLYGPRGLLQYQFVVPFGAEGSLRTILERLSSSGHASFLAVIKRLGERAGLLSFPIPGWTLTLDMPAGGRDLPQLLDGLDELVAQAGGRVYFAKDSRLRPELVPPMYPALGRWRELRAELDPESRMRSDLARRLALLEAA